MALYFPKIAGPSAGEGRTRISGTMGTRFLIGSLTESQQSMSKERKFSSVYS